MPKLARTNAEAHLFMDQRPCACGERRFARLLVVEHSATHALPPPDRRLVFDETAVGVYRL